MAVYVDHTIASKSEIFEKLTENIPKTFEAKRKE